MKGIIFIGELVVWITMFTAIWLFMWAYGSGYPMPIVITYFILYGITASLAGLFLDKRKEQLDNNEK